MEDLDLEIARLYTQDRSGFYPTEESYREAVDRAIEMLKFLRDDSVYLPEDALRVFVISMIKDHHVSLYDVQTRIAAAGTRPKSFL